jgi:hypothetical protein
VLGLLVVIQYLALLFQLEAAAVALALVLLAVQVAAVIAVLAVQEQ